MWKSWKVHIRRLNDRSSELGLPTDDLICGPAVGVEFRLLSFRSHSLDGSHDVLLLDSGGFPERRGPVEILCEIVKH